MSRLPDNKPIHPARPIAGAAAFAVAELAAGLLAGGYFAGGWERAEALLFLAFRPWLLLAAAVAVAAWRPPSRFALYGLALLIAGAGESLLLLRLGGEPWIEMLRGWAAGAALLVPFELAIQSGRRVGGPKGRWTAAVLLALLMLVPGAQRPYERIALGPTAAAPAAERPPLVAMTSLPLVWGVGGAFDPDSRPAAAWQALRHEFDPRPVDYLDAEALAGERLLLLAQPRLLAPEELAMLDAWVRGGGRALILVDPALVWPGAPAPGDVRRPAGSNMLAPLMAHWGIALEPPARPRVAVIGHDAGRGRRRLRLVGRGRLVAGDSRCAAEADFVLACRIGAGAAIVVADADLLHDATWTGPGERGTERHARTSDNPLALADWLDRLAGIERPRTAGTVRWTEPAASRRAALLIALLPILAALAAAGVAAARASRLNSPAYPQDGPLNRDRTETGTEHE